MKIKIRNAVKEDMKQVHDLIVELAIFEKEPDEVEIAAYYDGAPEYRIELKAPDWEVAESHWELVEAAISKTITDDIGVAEILRQ